MDVISSRDIDWAHVNNVICKVQDFTPIAQIQREKIISTNRRSPYALVVLTRGDLRRDSTYGIAHKLDFRSLWAVFVERGINPEEEVIVCWRKGKLRGISKLFSRFMPGLAIMVCRAGAFDLLTDKSFRPELTGEARFNAERPILDLTPEVLK